MADEQKRRVLGLCWYLLFAGFLAQVSGQLQISSTGANPQPFTNPSRITVGLASDLIIQVQCTSQQNTSSNSNIRWTYSINGSQVDMGLRAFGTSQENGVLRVYPASVLTGNGSMFQCSDGDLVLNVTFDLQDDLFFLNPIPPTVSSFANRLELCAVPDIPTTNVSIMDNTSGQTSYFYCEVDTERGIFRSRSVIRLPAPSFKYEPENITARPVNGTATAAFSCSVRPVDDLVEIQWFFDPMPFGSGSGSGMGLRPGPPSGMLFNDTAGGIRIHQPADPGTSILILESVGDDFEGFYSCVAVFPDQMITSSEAALRFNRTSLSDDDVIILAPPTSVSVTEGDAVSLPCVGSSGAAPSFSLAGEALPTNLSGPYSLDFPSVSFSDAGNYTCQVGEATAIVTVNVDVMLECPSMENITVFSRPLFSSEIVLIPSPALMLRLQCPRTLSGVNSSGVWLRNGVMEPNPVDLTVSSGGIYQCVGEIPDQDETDFTGEPGSNVYILTQNVSVHTITPSMATFTFGRDIETTLNCYVSGNPLPLIEWTSSSLPVNGTLQTVTGFNETAFSTLSINITELGVGTHSFSCMATVDSPSSLQPASSAVVATIVVQAVLQNISVLPETQDLILESGMNDTVTFNCSVEALPGPPRIEWLSNGVNVTSRAGPVTLVGEILYLSELTLSLGELARGRNLIICSAFQDAETPPTMINDTAVVNIFVAPNFTVSPEDFLAVVDDIVVLTCSAQATPPPNITWEFSNGTTVMDDDLFNISFALEGDDVTTTSVLSFLAREDLAGYAMLMFRCMAANDVGNATSNTAAVTIHSMPMFVTNPESDIVIVGYQVTLTCSAEATPTLPNITWWDGDGVEIINDQIFSISPPFSSEYGNETFSMLNFNATAAENRTGNGSMFQCRATVQLDLINRTLVNDSEVATITIAGVPGSPAPVTVDDIASQTAVVSWQLPFSLISITNYTVTVIEITTPGLTTADPMLVDSDVNFTMVNLTDAVLQPNRRYRVTVVAFNSAGRGEEATSENFTTLEGAPTGSPNITSVSSTRLREISLSWTEVLPDLQNGMITNYTVIFQSRDNASNVTVLERATTLNASDGISAGMTYSITVLASTIAGQGPQSLPVVQETIVQPPSIVNDAGAEPITVIMNAVSQTTIPITLGLQSMLSGSFSHFWVIAMKVDANYAASIQQDGTVRFPNGSVISDNSSFVLYSDNIPNNTPYIVAEVSASSLMRSINFILGDETATQGLNEYPTYRNGPLTEGTQYTVFLWGFPSSVPDGRQKRQTSVRQYIVFSSSRFLPPVFTATTPVPDSLSAGAIAAIIVVIILLSIAIGVLLVIAIMVYMRWRVRLVDLPPPNRKGSMRLRDKREVIQDASTASLIKNHRAESELQQLTPDDVRLPVAVEEFSGYCKMMHANSDHLFSEEYEILTIKSPSLPHIQCSMPHNVHKNRYANINCYDDSRVHLSVMPGVEGSDYINANYIDGYQRKCAYVATQGPLPNTTYDFWRMVWEMNSCCVIMLTNLVEKSRAKCHQYWPEVGSLNLGDLTVTLIEVQQLAYYTIRTFRMSRGNDRREVKQFHYTGWPDFGVPDHPNPVIAFIRRLANFKRTTDGPDIIHCSAGVGRTGTLVSIQCMIQMMSEEGKIDIFNFVLGMRRQRNYMVQTERQYIFLHDAILEIMKIGDTEIPIQSLRRRYKELQGQDPNTESSKMESEFAQLNELQNIDQSQFQAAKMTVNLPKNRFQDILPYERYRVRLLLHPGVSGSDYINASYIDGYQQRHQYIVTQGPLKDTVDDFWRMVWEHRASTIMMLCQLEEKGKEQCVRYWPNEKIRQHGDMFVELTQVTEFATYTMREFSITNTKINESRTIKQYQYTDWLEDLNPSNASAIIDLIGVLQKSQHNNGGGPIIVHDSTSVGRSGTFCVMSSVLEQLKVEGIVDLFFTIHSLRQQQPGLVQTVEQYKFCYQAVMEFLDSFDHYANFD